MWNTQFIEPDAPGGELGAVRARERDMVKTRSAWVEGNVLERALREGVQTEKRAADDENDVPERSGVLVEGRGQTQNPFVPGHADRQVRHCERYMGQAVVVGAGCRSSVAMVEEVVGAVVLVVISSPINPSPVGPGRNCAPLCPRMTRWTSVEIGDLVAGQVARVGTALRRCGFAVTRVYGDERETVRDQSRMPSQSVAAVYSVWARSLPRSMVRKSRTTGERSSARVATVSTEVASVCSRCR